MQKISNLKINYNFFLAVFFVLLPFSFLKSSVLNFVLISFFFLVVIFFYKFFKISLIFSKDILIVLIFFGYLITQSIFIDNDFSFKKSFFYLKFLFLFFVFALVLKNKKINVNYISKIYMLFISFLILDLFIQYFLGKNLFGYSGSMRGEIIGATRHAGIFNDELVLGGFLSTIGLASLGLYFYEKNFTKNNLFFFFIFLFLIFGAIILTGDRSPAISIIFIIIFNAFFNIGARKYFIIISLLCILVTFLSVVFSPALQHRYISEIKKMLNLKDNSYKSSIEVANSYVVDSQNYLELLNSHHDRRHVILASLDYIIDKKTKFENFDDEYKDTVKLKKYLYEKPSNKFIDILKMRIEKNVKEKNIFLNLEKKLNQIKQEDNLIVKSYLLIFNKYWGRHYSVALEIFSDHKIFGSGIKSFRFLCKEYDKEYQKYYGSRCSTHPHNLVFEILSETGLVGLILFLLLILNLLFKIIHDHKDKSFFERFSQVFLLSILLSFLIPLKPTGSIFSSWFGATFWFVYSSTYFLYLKK